MKLGVFNGPVHWQYGIDHLQLLFFVVGVFAYYL